MEKTQRKLNWNPISLAESGEKNSIIIPDKEIEFTKSYCLPDKTANKPIIVIKDALTTEGEKEHKQQ